MRHKKRLFFLQSGRLIIISLGLMLLWTAQPVDAQCGSQASSCKSCHEVQGQDPVNADGTGWHESHAFGDFCYVCHAGNPQASDELAAHTGMVPPMADIEPACQQCHAADLEERAQVYATILNIELGGGTGSLSELAPTEIGTGSVSEPLPTDVSTEMEAAVNELLPTPIPITALANNELVIDDPNLVDYVQRYKEIVLGERPVNVGNIVLIALIALIALGGGGFVIVNEIRRSIALSPYRQVDGSYPDDVVEMLPALARLKYETRKSLQKLFQNPKQTDAVVNLIGTLDPAESPSEHTAKRSEESAS